MIGAGTRFLIQNPRERENAGIDGFRQRECFRRHPRLRFRQNISRCLYNGRPRRLCAGLVVYRDREIMVNHNFRRHPLHFRDIGQDAAKFLAERKPVLVIEETRRPRKCQRLGDDIRRIARPHHAERIRQHMIRRDTAHPIRSQLAVKCRESVNRIFRQMRH